MGCTSSPGNGVGNDRGVIKAQLFLGKQGVYIYDMLTLKAPV